MRFDVLNLILGWTLVALTLPLLFCVVITGYLDDWELALRAFSIPAGLSLFIGAMMLRFGTKRNTHMRLRDREAFAAVALVWPLAVFIGALPYWLGGMFHGPFTDGSSFADVARGAVNAWFESMSGFSTTGATVISTSMSPNCLPGMDCINSQPRGLLFWRSLTQWFGGMGIIMLGMMILSRVIGGGMALARAELTGPSLSRLKPKLQETALALWGLYLVLTLIEFVLLWTIGDMNWFDSINHALTTMPTGGFSTYDASIGHFDSYTVELIIILFMFIGGINFTLLWFIREGQFKKATQDEEFKNYIVYILTTFLFITIALLATRDYSSTDAFIDSLFHVVSLGTSTGYTSTDYMQWPVVTHLFLFVLMIVGASAGSTSGGLKLLRINLAFKVAMRELVRIAQPRKVRTIRMNGEVVGNQQLGLIVGMLFVWIGLFAISSILLAFISPGEDFESILALVASSLGNTGPTIGNYGPTETWAGLNSGALILTSILMWFGRLELLTAVILLHPHTWRSESKDQAPRGALARLKRMISREPHEESEQGPLS
ncbi:MAG: TrkH family potassium uptake protein [Candidatus Thermoplasmatota archaeon]|nr:TrkH family potassium uptake protein [Candidatus Thermoplasmatota archaeon]MEC8609183.1 TrkH family potassium uptake protein [Candidatus Thermoplasmatota archaeon]